MPPQIRHAPAAGTSCVKGARNAWGTREGPIEALRAATIYRADRTPSCGYGNGRIGMQQPENRSKSERWRPIFGRGPGCFGGWYPVAEEAPAFVTEGEDVGLMVWAWPQTIGGPGHRRSPTRRQHRRH